MLSKAMEFQGDNLKVDPSSTALGRMASAEEVAPFILFLLGRKPVSSPELHIARWWMELLSVASQKKELMFYVI
jgi:hypothetical protein